MWWFSSTYNKIDVGGYVRGVFCPYTVEQASMLGIASSKPLCFSTKWNRHIYSVTSCDKNFLKDGDRTKLKLTETTSGQAQI